jgi:hypothetical protein
MMGKDLVELAQRLVELDRETAEVRRRMLALLSNGADTSPAHPPRPARRSGGTAKPPKAKSPSRDEVMAKSAAADEAALVLIRSQPGVKTGEIATATQAKGTTMAERLRRLKEKGLVAGGGSEGWTAAS